MKKVTIQKYLNLYVLLLALGIGSVGCQRKTYTHPIVPAASEGVAQAQDSGSKEEGEFNLTGTSDPGGGNGLDGKVFESYSQDILSHLAYKNYVEPLFVSMSKNTAEIQSKQGLKPNEQDAEKSRRSYERLFQYKRLSPMVILRTSEQICIT